MQGGADFHDSVRVPGRVRRPGHRGEHRHAASDRPLADKDRVRAVQGAGGGTAGPIASESIAAEWGGGGADLPSGGGESRAGARRGLFGRGRAAAGRDDLGGGCCEQQQHHGERLR
ncbi:unnamed protein product, partial [Effrenium voratum]